MSNTLFHVTDPANVESILREGLRADGEGCIFTLTDDRLANSIARDQLGLREYAVLGIDPKGISGRMETDQVAEFAAGWHRVIRQPRIAPAFLRFIHTLNVDPGPTEGDYMRWGTRGVPRAQVDAMYAMMRAGPPTTA